MNRHIRNAEGELARRNIATSRELMRQQALFDQDGPLTRSALRVLRGNLSQRGSRHA